MLPHDSSWNAVFSEPFHLQLARTLCRIGGETDSAVELAVALTSHFLSEGHVCFDLARPVRELIDGAPRTLPSTDEWQSRIAASSLCRSDPAGRAPLVLDRSGRLYLQRFHALQTRLANAIVARTDGRLHIISGGPGSGKTTQIAARLMAWIEQARLQSQTLRFLALAPTGKAASRLKESLQAARMGQNPASIDYSREVREALPEEALTIHRALGINPHRASFAFRNADNPLNADIVVVDECSMVDLRTIVRLFDALAPHARVVLVGDRNQLCSVEAGAVFSDICAAAAAGSLCHADYTELTDQHRFAPDSAIAALARCIRDGSVDAAMTVLKNADAAELRWITPDTAGRNLQHLIDEAADDFTHLHSPDPLRALSTLSAFRFITPLRDGPLSARSLNERMQRALAARGLLNPGHHNASGRPVMITVNDYAANLFNGDTGVVQRQPDGGHCVIFRDGDAGIRSVPFGRLPPVETVYAMTVHKTQGSEMDHVMVVLPQGNTRLFFREMLYTAVTRARSRLTIFASEASLTACIQNSQQRMSGLVDALAEAR